MQFENQRIKEFIVGLLLSASGMAAVSAQEPGRIGEVVRPSSRSENWLHIYRDASPVISPVDRGPFDEYLDLDYLEVKGEWSLVHIKTVRDDPPTEYHGKLALATMAISCKQIRFGYPYIGDFYDAEGRIPMRETTMTFADLDRFAIGRVIPASSPAAIYYRFACLGLKPRPEEIGMTVP